MTSLILIIDNEQRVLNSLSSILKDHNYKVAEAQSGKQALNILSTSEKLPDLIICDVKMPELDGFETFKRISENPEWSQIPFIFLSRLSSPYHVRMGKSLGVDDYLLKPVKEEDLIAVVKGKIARYHRIKENNEKIKRLYFNLREDIIPDNSGISNNIIFLYMHWDEIKGPSLITSHYNGKPTFSMEKIGGQLFQGLNQIYSINTLNGPEDLLLFIQNIKRKAYVLLDLLKYEETMIKFILCIISENINYFQSLELRALMLELSENIKKEKNWSIKDYWPRVYEVLLG